jgi:hypothetical protein
MGWGLGFRVFKKLETKKKRGKNWSLAIHILHMMLTLGGPDLQVHDAGITSI